MDVLQEIPVEQWPLLMQKVKALWPLNVGGYYALHQNLKYPAIKEFFKFKVFCPYGDMDIGYIATYRRGPRNGVLIFPNSKDTKRLEDALLNTNLIKNAHVIGMASSLVIQLMKNIKAKLELKTFDLWRAKMLFLDKSTKQFEDVKCPTNTYLARVKEDDIERVNSIWSYKYPGSDKMLSNLACNGLSYGLYSDNKLLAWMFINEYKFFCHLYCEEDQRKRGYAEYVLKCVVNEQLNKGEDLYCFVASGNEAAESLFFKLGFKHVDDIAWITVGKV